LIASLPSLERRGGLQGIAGLAPLLRDLPAGCAFHPRCPMAEQRCRTEAPALRSLAGSGVIAGDADAVVACHLAEATP
jgi:oligopeptide/dipeptide ABC transporter ATP-binding protein